MIGPPPRPWKIRAAISVVRSGAAPEMNELTVNRVQQIRKNRFCRCYTSDAADEL
jgi:coenzyme F420-reducing hydrogenase gamma subunit